jgi:DNA-binding beta-propeller fold protein YncE
MTSLLLYVDGLAWDWINEKLYWTDYCQDDIEVYDPTTGYRAVLFNTGLIEPHAIVVDPTTK